LATLAFHRSPAIFGHPDLFLASPLLFCSSGCRLVNFSIVHKLSLSRLFLLLFLFSPSFLVFSVKSRLTTLRGKWTGLPNIVAISPFVTPWFLLFLKGPSPPPQSFSFPIIPVTFSVRIVRVFSAALGCAWFPRTSPQVSFNPCCKTSK